MGADSLTHVCAWLVSPAIRHGTQVRALAAGQGPGMVQTAQGAGSGARPSGSRFSTCQEHLLKVDWRCSQAAAGRGDGQDGRNTVTQLCRPGTSWSSGRQGHVSWTAQRAEGAGSQAWPRAAFRQHTICPAQRVLQRVPPAPADL